MTSFRITSPADASVALEYFNAFHDGFIRKLVLRSHDRFEARGVQEISGRLDLDILFAHYNYRTGEPPADQLVRARFTQVSRLIADIPMAPGAWSVDRIEIGAGQAGEMEARVIQHRLVEGAWTAREDLRFAFEAADMEEVDGRDR